MSGGKFQVAVVVAMAMSSQVHADLAAALHRSGANNKVPALPMEAPLARPLIIGLERVNVQSSSNHKASFYLGKINIGQPRQELKVMFDTSSGAIIVPHRACKSVACVEHRHYSPWQSLTSMDIQNSGAPVQEGKRLASGKGLRDAATVSFTQADLGVGDAKAVMVRDTVCLAGSNGHMVNNSCIDMGIMAAVTLDDVPFKAMPNDGIVGLGRDSLTPAPMFSFIGRLFDGSQNVPRQFGISFGSKSGELYLGGYNAARLEGPLVWLPVDHPESGFWQVAIHSVRVGGTTVDACLKGCHGIVDTGASKLGVQASKLPAVSSALSSAPSHDGGCNGPILEFDLGDVTLTLSPQDYADTECVPRLGSLDLEEPDFVGVYAFGETVLRRYYAAFDWESQRVGFAPAADLFATVIV